MNNATVFALTSTTGALALAIGFVAGRCSVIESKHPTQKEYVVREVTKEVPVVREVVKEVPAPPDEAAIAAAVEVRLAAKRASEKDQFWAQVRGRFDQMRRRAIVDAVRATNTQSAHYGDFMGAISYDRTIDLAKVTTRLYHLLRQPDIGAAVEYLVKDALEYAIAMQDEAARRGY